MAAVSDRVSTPARPDVHSLMPAFLFAGNGDTNEGLHRVYVFSDSDCVNAVYRGAIVGGPAYAPRTSGPLDLPHSAEDLEKARGTILKDGEEGDTFALDTAPVTTSETVADASGSTPSASAGDKPASPDANAASAGAKVDLWDRDGKPGGRYYSAVVPVQVVDQDDKVVYRETELPQDACQGTLAADGTQTAPSASSRSARTAPTPCRSRRRSGCRPPGDSSWVRRATPRSTGLRS